MGDDHPAAPDTTRLSPADLAVAVRSFPRRFRAVFAAADDEDDSAQPEADPDDIVRRVGPDGTTALDHLVDAHARLRHAAVDLAAVLSNRADARDEAASTGPSSASTTGGLGATLEGLDGAADALANRIDSVTTDDWARTVPADSGPRSALSLVQSAVGEVSVRLRRAETTLRAVR